MIITDLRATNVLKYGRLEINNIPSKGQIAISGPNESGKTAVVESICFALFGRTFSHSEDNLKKIIKWGEADCHVELTFAASDGSSYTVGRTLDSDGLHAAQLFRNGEKEPFATGPSTVRDEVVRLCGFDYPQYLDALYLAQMEISAPHSQGETIKEITGTGDLEAVAEELEAEMAREQAAIDEVQHAIMELTQQIEGLGLEADAAARVEGDRSGLTGRIDENRASITRLEEISSGFRDAASDLKSKITAFARIGIDTPLSDLRAQVEDLRLAADAILETCDAVDTDNRLCTERALDSRITDLEARIAALDPVMEKAAELRARLGALAGDRSMEGVELSEAPLPRQESAIRGAAMRSRFTRSVVGLLFLATALAAMAAWSGWWLTKPAEGAAQAGWAAAWTLQNVPGWKAEYFQWLLPAAIGTTALAVLLLIWASALNARLGRSQGRLAEIGTRLQTLQGQIDTLDRLDAVPVAEAVAFLRSMDDDELIAAIETFEKGDGGIWLDGDRLGAYQAQWGAFAREFEDDLSDLREAVAARIGSLGGEIASAEQRLADLETDLANLRERQQQAEEMGKAIADLEPRIEQHRSAIELRELALKLTRETCDSIYKRFNGVLSKYTADVMPKLTEGRYSQMQIDENLRFRVFSNKKNDFGELVEFSSGTQRQMLLAVRLAMAKAMVEASGQKKQFIILDEPFAFFDRERIFQTLRALPDIDRHVTQIWIISQEFESYDQFKMNVRCTRDSDELVIGEPSRGFMSREKSGPGT